MVQMEWGPYRNKFHQYILNNLSTTLSTTIQPNLTTTNLAVPVADLDSLAAVNGSFPSDTQYEPSLTDTTLFTAEIGFYCGILSAVIVVLIASGVCYTIHVVANRSNTHSSPIITRERRSISQPIPPLRPLLSTRDRTTWTEPLNSLSHFHFSPSPTRFPHYDYPPPPKPVYHVVDFLPLPDAPESVYIENTISSPDTEFPPPPSPLQPDAGTVADGYWAMN